MEILLNGTPLDVEGLNEEVKLAELLITVEESLKGSGTTVISINADGEEISPDDLEILADKAVLSFEKVELITVSAQEMIRLAVEDGTEGIAHLEEVANQVSADLRIGKVKDAMEQYIQLVDGFEWLSIMLKNADRAFAAVMAESSLESERQALITRLKDQMTMAQKAQEGEDWVEMADILEYEFPELFDDGRSFFHKILNQD